MLNTVLYRAKLKNDKSAWVYGVPYKPITQPRDSYDRMFMYTEYMNRFEIDTNTLGQYCGYNDDINRTMIFEGDIIIVNPSIFGSSIERKVCVVDDIRSITRIVSGLKQIEVIGNIYDNPELLEEVK